MDFLTLLTYLVALAMFGLPIYLANQDQVAGRFSAPLRWLLYAIVALFVISALAILQGGLLRTPELEAAAGLNLPEINPAAALVNLILALVFAGVSVAIIGSARARQGLQRILGGRTAYNPDSPVHMTAVVLSLAVLSLIFGQVIFGGGVSGIAEIIEQTGIRAGEILLTGILWVLASLLGVGLAIRRTPAQSAERLGLRLPTGQDWTFGVAGGLILFGLQILLQLVWTLFTSPEQFAEQTAAAEQISRAINTLPLALLVALSAAIGEEIFFRGALQPVFGLWATSIFFALVHAQYALTPATLVILIVSLGMGYIRQRASTTAAMIAHFLYNFIPLSLAVLYGSLSSGG